MSARTLVLDGELVMLDEHLRSRFEWLREPDASAVATQPLLMVFDLLYRDGRDLTARPLRDRRARLEDVVAGSRLIFPVRRLATDGLEGVEAGTRTQLRGLRREGRGQPVRGLRDAAVVEGKPEQLVDAADQHGAHGELDLSRHRA